VRFVGRRTARIIATSCAVLSTAAWAFTIAGDAGYEGLRVEVQLSGGELALWVRPWSNADIDAVERIHPYGGWWSTIGPSGGFDGGRWPYWNALHIDKPKCYRLDTYDLYADTTRDDGTDVHLPEHPMMAYFIGIPLWMLLALSGMLALTLWHRDRRLVLHGHCGRCGYDLTKNESGICPECGVGIRGAEGKA